MNAIIAAPDVFPGNGRTKIAPALLPCARGQGDHFVQFYTTDDFLVQSVSRYAHDGIAAGEVVILIATASHLSAITGTLADTGNDVAALQAEGRLLALDANETLARFMRDDLPDRALFHRHVGSHVAQAAAQGKVRAFGEMVSLLWNAGQAEAALRLEDLWNELAQRCTFQLCCAYPMQGFASEASARLFMEVCNAHQRVLPAETYDEHASPRDRARAVAILQQKAVALEAEVVERKRVEAALRRGKEELTVFVENASIGLHWVGPDGVILWANQAEMDLLGYQRTEYIGRHIEHFHADKPAIDDILSRLCRGEKLRNYEARLRCKSGMIKTVLIDSSVLWDNGRFVHTQCFTRDITQQKRAEQALAAARDALGRANEELERQVFERTAALREAVAQMEEFSYTVSHDLRAPLRGMQVYSQALLEDYAGALNSEARHCLQRIAENAARLDRMVTDVLTFSKVGRSELQVHRVSLEKLVHDVIEHDPALKLPHAKVRVEQLLDVLGHEPLIVQAFSNLLGNAVKFVAPGVLPQVRVWSESCEGDVRVWVEDNGIGIPAVNRSRLFRMFERLHTDQRFDGTGIGLAIVRKAVTRLGGDVGVESDGMNGSRFWVRLPGA